MKKYSLIIFAAFLALTASCSSSDDSSPIDKPVIDNPSKPNPNPKPDPKPESNKGFNYIPVDQDQQAYYKGVDFTKRGDALQKELHDLVERTHNPLSYTPNVWNATKITDVNPKNPNEVILIYGWPEGQEKDVVHKRTMDIHATNNSSYTTEEERRNLWEREHVFAKANAKKSTTSGGYPLVTANYAPSKENDLITLIAGNDVHHLRAINGFWNNKRSNTIFVDGNGNSGNQNGGWFPGEEWKGDVARMMMYMFLRYGELCKPIHNAKSYAVVNIETGNMDMLKVYLKWNAEDPVSEIERRRNEYHGDPSNRYSQGNRNPFIDNPHLANLIWGVQSEKNLNAKNIWTEVKPDQK